jgi:hypothetical protein
MDENPGVFQITVISFCSFCEHLKSHSGQLPTMEVTDHGWKTQRFQQFPSVHSLCSKQRHILEQLPNMKATVMDEKIQENKGFVTPQPCHLH